VFGVCYIRWFESVWSLLYMVVCGCLEFCYIGGLWVFGVCYIWWFVGVWSLLYTVVCGCLFNHRHTRQEGMTGLFQAKETEHYGHPHEDDISLTTVHLPQVTVFSHLTLAEVLKKAIFGIINSHSLR